MTVKTERYTKKTNGKDARFYPIEALGRDVPSVTTILGQIDKSGPLMGWAIKCMRQYAGEKLYQAVKEKTPLSFELVDIILDESAKNYRKVQEDALDFGSEMHNLLEVHLRGQNADGLLKAHPFLEKPYYEFLKWAKAVDLQVIESETTVWSELGFAGTTDFVGRIDGVLTIADWKSSKAIYDEYLIQVSAYWYAYEERTGQQVDLGGVLRLPKELTEKWSPEKNWQPFSRSEMEARFAEFKCLLDYFNLTTKRRAK